MNATIDHEALKTIRAQHAAEIISRALRTEYSAYVESPNHRGTTPSARENAGYYLTQIQPIACFNRERPAEEHGYWANTHDWIFRGLGCLSDILEPWRTDREAETILVKELQRHDA